MICPVCGYTVVLTKEDVDMMKKLTGPELVTRGAQVERIKTIEVPVEKIVEKRVEVPGPERVVEKIVEIPIKVEVPVEVEKIVEVPIEVPGRDIIREVEVEKIVKVPGPRTEVEVITHRTPTWAKVAMGAMAVAGAVGWWV